MSEWGYYILYAPHDPDKLMAYDRFIDIFYHSAEGKNYKQIQVPYENSCLPAIFVPSKGKEKDSILLHGGFDSVMDEFVRWAQYFSESGYRVILFCLLFFQRPTCRMTENSTFGN